MLEGDPYVWEWSSFGERGVERIYVDAPVDIRLRGGICRKRPAGKEERCGVLGLLRALSSRDLRSSDSRNFRAGDRVGGPPSDKLRALEGDREVAPCSLLEPTSVSSVVFSSFASILANISTLSWLPAMMQGGSRRDLVRLRARLTQRSTAS